MFSGLVGSLQFGSDGGIAFGSSLITADCAINTGVVVGVPRGQSMTAAGFDLGCLERTGDNYRRIFDGVDVDTDITALGLGVLLLDSSVVGAYPRPVVEGPQIVGAAAAARGVSLRVIGDDLDDGPLPASAGYWTDEDGMQLGNLDTYEVPATLTAGTTLNLVAHVIDSDGNESAIPWPVSITSGNVIWPNRNRWRAAVLRTEQLPPTTNATAVATFRWRCFAPGCTTTCALDPPANADITTVATAPCRSPVEVEGLSPGPHTFVVQPRDSSGRVIDLPQRYQWTVVAPTADPTSGAAAPVVDIVRGVGDDGAVDVAMTSVDTPNQVVTCSVDGRRERPCRTGLSVSGIGANGLPAQELTIRVRDRSNGFEVQSSRGIHLNDPDDIDGDGWIDRDANGNVVDPCLTGAERVCP